MPHGGAQKKNPSLVADEMARQIGSSGSQGGSTGEPKSDTRHRQTKKERDAQAGLKFEQIRMIGRSDESIQWWSLYCDRKVLDVYSSRLGDQLLAIGSRVRRLRQTVEVKQLGNAKFIEQT